MIEPLPALMPSATLASIGAGVLSVHPPVLFFVLGIIAALVRSNLSVPKAVTKLMALYLLWAIGFKGGSELAKNGMTPAAVSAMGLGVAIPLYSAIVKACR